MVDKNTLDLADIGSGMLLRKDALWVLACLLLLCFGGTNGSPRAEGVSTGSQLVEFFVGTCLRPLPDLERIRAAARALDWKPLDRDKATMLAPVDRSAKWQGWLVPEGDDVFLFGVSEGSWDSQKMLSCVAASQELDQGQLLAELQGALDLTPVTEDLDALQWFRAWKTEIEGQSLMVHLTTLSNSRFSPVSLAGVAFSR